MYNALPALIRLEVGNGSGQALKISVTWREFTDPVANILNLGNEYIQGGSTGIKIRYPRMVDRSSRRVRFFFDHLNKQPPP